MGNIGTVPTLADTVNGYPPHPHGGLDIACIFCYIKGLFFRKFKRIPATREEGNAVKILYWFLVLVPVAIVAHLVGAPPVVVFSLSALALIPLSGILGEATEELAARIGESWGGLLNATFGNLAELIIAIVAIRAGAIELVKASIVGSVIGNLLFVLGMSLAAGGFRYETLKFRRELVGPGVTSLFVAMTAMAIPTIAHFTPGDATLEHGSMPVATILFVLYVLGIVKHFRTPDDEATLPTKEVQKILGERWSTARAIITLATAAATIAVMSDILVHHLEGFCNHLGWTPTFVGLIIIPIVGNVAEHFVAVQVALKNRMDLSLSIAVNSATQVALLVAPIAVFTAAAMGHEFTLVFQPLAVEAIGAAVVATFLVTHDEKSDWYEGVMLLALYAIFGVMCYIKT